jgi:serine/threonine protein kinase/biopolymer transport protein ExbD
MNTSPLCPECGKPLPAGSDHCPACLMAQAMASRTLDGDSGKTVPRPPPEPEEIAGKFPQFEILECLGRGGMGVVYKARQKALDRIVAIKILAGEWQDYSGFAGRFEKEAKLLARLNHPNIVTIHDFGNAGGLFHIVMEFIDGVNVRDLLRDGKMAPEQALAIVPPICDALQFAHDHGIVHRDIKPENILLDREGRVKIADFGIATLAGDAADRSGTPAYMAPEQEAHAARIDHRADIYALGVVLYEMLTGERPTTSPVAPSKQVQIDVRLDEVVLRALENKPELRFQQASEIRTRVETIMDRRPAALLKSQEGCLSLYIPGGERMPYPWKGGLSLHDDRLVISTKTGPREVPLAAIRATGMAIMPAWFSPAGHRYVSVDFEEAEKPGRLVFLPLEGIFGLPATAEVRTQDWLHIIGQAVRAATGRSLPEPSPLPSTLPMNPLLSLVWLLPLVTVVVVLGFVMFGMTAKTPTETQKATVEAATARFTGQQGWPFEEQSPRPVAKVETREVVIEAIGKGEVLIDGKKATIRDMKQPLAEIAQENRQTPVRVKAGWECGYPAIQTILQKCARANLGNVAMDRDGPGPVSEVTLHERSDFPSSREMVDLDTGSVAIFKIEAEALQRADTEGMDLSFSSKSGEWMLITSKTGGMKLRLIAPFQSPILSKWEIEQALMNPSPNMTTTNDGDWIGHILPAPLTRDLAIAFETRSGNRGVLRLLGWGDEPAQLGIQYRLFDPGSKVVPAPTKTIFVSATGEYTLEGFAKTLEELEEETKRLAGFTIRIVARPNAPAESVTKVLDACAKAGLPDVHVEHLKTH